MAHIITDHTHRWPGGCVVWHFHPGLSADEKDLFRTAMDEWENRADVRFIERSTQSSYVTYKADETIDNVNYSSSIGMSGGEQFVRLEPIITGDSRGRACRHEIGHVIGFKHEHQRCDRDAFVTVNTHLKAERQGDYTKLCGDDVKEVGDYDFTSIMHYNPSKRATTNDKVDLIGTTPANQTQLDDPDSRRHVSPGDAAAVAELHGGNAHVYQLTGDGQIEKTLHQHHWTPGWTIATPFLMDVRNFLFLLKTSDGRMHVSVIEGNGSIGALLDNRNWTDGWTHALKYTILTTNYLLLYKRGDGTVHLDTINADGTIGPKVWDQVIETGWTSIRQYAIGWDNFLHFYNSATGAWRVRRINADGRIGDSIQAANWSTGWTTLAPYSAGGTTYLLRLKAGTGHMEIKKFRPDGTLPPSETVVRDWDPGWTTAIPYEVLGSVFLLLLNGATGHLKILRLKGDGTVGAVTDERMFGTGWTLGAAYNVGAGNYVLLIKT